MATTNRIVTFEKGDPHTYEMVPDTVSDAEVKAKAAKEFPGRKIVSVTMTVYKPDNKKLKPGEKPSVDPAADIGKSSEKPAGKTPTVDASSDEDKKDYRADFPTLYTPPGFIRNKRGDLIYY
jgi:hypothetical protein